MTDPTDTTTSQWRDWLAARFDRKMKQVQAQNPTFFDQVSRQGRGEALASLGLAELYTELYRTHNDLTTLAREKEQIQRQMIAALRNIPLADIVGSIEIVPNSGFDLPQEVATALTRREAAHQRLLLINDPLGQELLRLQAERDALRTTVRLALAPPALRRLWARVNNILGDERTTLELATLTLEAPPEA